MNGLLHDLRFALRTLRKNPAYALIAVVTIALGIGANSAIFSVVNAALIRPLPYAHADRLVYLGETNKNRPYPGQLSYGDYQALKQQNASLEDMAAFGFDNELLTGYGEAQVLSGARVTSSFFPLLGVNPALGRSFTAEEEAGAGAPAMMLTDSLWRETFHADPQIIGKGIRISNEAYTVVGVLPANFYFAKTPMAKAYFALRPQDREKERRYFHWMWVLGRAKVGVSMQQVQADLVRVASQFSSEDPKYHANVGLGAVSLQRDIVGDFRPVLLVLMTAVAFVLLIACANVANLMLARTNARQKELATRIALGASRWHIARMLLAESTVLAVVGAAVGVLWANWGGRPLASAIPASVRESAPYLNSHALSLGVILFSGALSVIAGLLFGALPALRFSRRDVNTTLKSAGTTTSGARSFAYDALIVGEVALALMLLVGAGLLTLSLNRMLHADPGFDSSNLVTAQVVVPLSYKSDVEVMNFQRAVLEKVRNLPGVQSVATTDALPLIGAGGTGSPTVVGRPAPEGRDYEAPVREVSAAYFETMRIPLVAGRSFEERDTIDNRRTVIINRQMAGDLFTGTDAVGQKVRFAFTGDTDWEIVGVVGNESVRTLDAPNAPVLYFHYGSDRGLSLVIRSSNIAVTESSIQSAIASLDPNAPVQRIATMEELVNQSPMTFVRRYPAILLTGFGSLALILALVGIYGVVAYSVSQRIREIGIRIALGARTAHVLSEVLKRNVVLTSIGLVVGIVGTIALGRFLEGLLFGVRASDPVILSASVILLAAVSLFASYIPARRATLVDPLISLREQ